MSHQNNKSVDVDALLKDRRTAIELLLSSRVEERLFILWQLFQMAEQQARMAALALGGLLDKHRANDELRVDALAALGVIDHVVINHTEFSDLLWHRIKEINGALNERTAAQAMN